MFFVEADAENPVAAGCVSAAISMLYLESADAEEAMTEFLATKLVDVE